VVEVNSKIEPFFVSDYLGISIVMVDPSPISDIIVRMPPASNIARKLVFFNSLPKQAKSSQTGKTGFC